MTPGLAVIAPRATGDGSCPIRCPGNEDMIGSELTPGTFLGSGKTSLFVRVANWEALMCKLQSSSCWKYLPPIDTEFGSALRRQMRRVLFSTLPSHLDFALPQSSSHPTPDVLSPSVSVTIDCRWNLQVSKIMAPTVNVLHSDHICIFFSRPKKWLTGDRWTVDWMGRAERLLTFSHYIQYQF